MYVQYITDWLSSSGPLMSFPWPTHSSHFSSFTACVTHRKSNLLKTASFTHRGRHRTGTVVELKKRSLHGASTSKQLFEIYILWVINRGQHRTITLKIAWIYLNDITKSWMDSFPNYITLLRKYILFYYNKPALQYPQLNYCTHYWMLFVFHDDLLFQHLT